MMKSRQEQNRRADNRAYESDPMADAVRQFLAG